IPHGVRARGRGESPGLPRAGGGLRPRRADSSLLRATRGDSRALRRSDGQERVVIYAEPRLLPCGDRAVSVELGDEISREVNARVLALEYLLREKAVGGVTETVPSFRALLVYYDPLVIGYEELGVILRALASEARADVLPPARTVELPCCY